MRIRHTVIFTFYDSTTPAQIDEVISRLNDMGAYLTSELGVTDWVVTKHIPETFRARRAHLLQDGIFPSLDALEQHTSSSEHARVIELTPNVCDWMTIDTYVSEN
jgi:hypothetical protein